MACELDGDVVATVRFSSRYETISDGEIIARLRRAASDGDLGADDQSRSMLAGYHAVLQRGGIHRLGSRFANLGGHRPGSRSPAARL
jgi:hypothetical protein